VPTDYTANLPSALFGIEASGAHFIGVALRQQGHNVRLIPAQFVPWSSRTAPMKCAARARCWLKTGNHKAAMTNAVERKLLLAEKTA